MFSRSLFGRAALSAARKDAASIQRCYKSTAPAASLMDNLPEMPPCDVEPMEHEGPDYETALATRKSKLNPALFTFYKKPVYIHQGHMQYLWDTSGKRYLDLFAGIVTVSVGHCHPKVVEAAEKQQRKLWHTTNIYMHPMLHEYAESLAAKFPGNLKNIYLTNSGSEANDLAILMARMHTGCFDSISLRNGYHGATSSLMGVTALSTWRYSTPSGFGFHQAMNPDPYRGPWGGKHCRDSVGQPGRDCDCSAGECKACDLYVDQLEDVIRHSMPKGRVGAFIAEAVQGVGGGVQLPDGYLKKAYEKVRARGGVCIADEVQTGFGRMGSHFWGFESQDVMPDIVVTAKGIGNGYPMGAVITTPEIASTMADALHFNTYGGNPVASAVGNAVLQVIEEDKTQQLCVDVGTYFLQELEKLRSEFEVIGDVRGKGLMIGVELVKDKQSREPLGADDVSSIWEDTKEMGVLIGKGGLHGNCLRIKPPMCINKQDVDYSIAVMRRAFERHADS